MLGGRERLNAILPGQYYDKETGLHYNYFRDYDPSTGRYVQSDPIGLAGGSFSTYGYAYQNPLAYVDPNGLNGQNAATWARGKAGKPGYRYLDPSSESRGRMQPFMKGRLTFKCNKFVWDALSGGGDPPGRMADGRIPSAGEWANPGVDIPGYFFVPPGSPLQPGDVISDGDHVGIYTPSSSCQQCTTSAAAPGTKNAGPFGSVVTNDWGFRPGQAPTARRMVTDFGYYDP